MEALQSLRPATTSRRLHDFRHSREHLERESQIKNRTRSLQTSAHLDKITRAPLAALGRGPTPRPKEQNDEFIQSWLQQTQARDSHLLKIDGQRRQLQVAEQSGASDHIRKHQKRPRPVSDPSPPSPKAAERVEHRFEKRARHKTRDDKYDYKPRADKKRVSDQAHRGHTATGDGKERALRTERQHLTHQRDAGIATSHMIPRASKLIPKTNRPSRHRSITRRTSEPNASRSKLSKSQKEDKELEEFSAFFSRKTTYDEPESRSYGVADQARHLHSLPDAESYPRSSHHEGRCSPHSLQRSYRSISVDGGRALPRYSSSLPAIQSRDSGLVRSSRPSNKHRSASAWSQQYDDCLVEDKPQSHSSVKDRSTQRGVLNCGKGRLHSRRESEPGVTDPSKRLSPDDTRDGSSGARKDAAAQTDLAPIPNGEILKRPVRPHAGFVARDGNVGMQRPYSSVLSLDGATQMACQARLGSQVEGEISSAPRLSRVAVPAEPHLHYRQHGYGPELCRFDDDWAVSGARHQYGPYAFVGRPAYISAPTRPISFVHGRERDEGPFLSLYSQPGEQTASSDRHLVGDGNFPQDEGRGVPGNFGFENLEQFIRRIEGEAAMPLGQREDDRALPWSEFGGSDWRDHRPLGLCNVANLDGADDTTVLAGRPRSRMEAGLSLLDSASPPAPSFQEPGYEYLDELSTQVPYPSNKSRGRETELWEQRDNF